MSEQSTTVRRTGDRPLRFVRPTLIHTSGLSWERRRTIRDLLDVAFDDFTDDDYDHALGGMHAIADDDRGNVVGHAAVVQRAMLLDGRPVRCGYVEAVAVHPDWGRRGIGAALMGAIESVIAGAYDFGALSASDQGRGLYLQREWVNWTGQLGVVTPEGLRGTPDDVGSVMVWNLADETVSGTLACDWRVGDVW